MWPEVKNEQTWSSAFSWKWTFWHLILVTFILTRIIAGQVSCRQQEEEEFDPSNQSSVLNFNSKQVSKLWCRVINWLFSCLTKKTCAAWVWILTLIMMGFGNYILFPGIIHLFIGIICINFIQLWAYLRLHRGDWIYERAPLFMTTHAAQAQQHCIAWDGDVQYRRKCTTCKFAW